MKHPKSRNELLHGYQLDVRNVPAIRSESALITLFEKIGTIKEVDKDDNIVKILVEGRSPQVYQRTRTLIKKYSIYRYGNRKFNLPLVFLMLKELIHYNQ